MGLKIIVTGGRDFHDYRYIHAVLYEIDQQVGIGQIIHGGAVGVDYACGEWGILNNKEVTVYRANWKDLGRAAGPVRNQTMLGDNLDADYVLAFPGGKGTENMCNMCSIAKKAGIDVVRVANPDKGEQ